MQTHGNLVHTELKPSNIMIDLNNHAFIVYSGKQKDFETTKKKSEINIRRSILPSRWLAPEMIYAQGYPLAESYRELNPNFSKLDVFSLGLITLFILDRDIFNSNKYKFNNDPIFMREYLADLERRNVLSNEFLSLTKKMLCFSVSERIPIKEIYDWTVKKIKYIDICKLLYTS